MQILRIIFLTIILLLSTSLIFQNTFAETKQFAVKPGQIITYSDNLNKGEKMNYSIQVTGGSGNDINFEVEKPSGILQLSVSCNNNICSNEYFIADEDGNHKFKFDNTFSLISSKNIVFEYNIERNPLNSGGGCLIATATFGSELAPQVQLLREIRDNTVLSTTSGTSFMTVFNTFYYSFSPTIADLERQNPVFKETVKVAIIPLLSSLSLLQYVDIDSEAEMLGYGISIILLNIGMYFVAPALIMFKIKSKLRNLN